MLTALYVLSSDVFNALLNLLCLDSAEQLSQWFSSPLYYYSSDLKEPVSRWRCESFMTICCPFRQRYFHGIHLGHIGTCILMPMAAFWFEQFYFISGRKKKYMILALLKKKKNLFFKSDIDPDRCSQIMPHLCVSQSTILTTVSFS